MNVSVTSYRYVDIRFFQTVNLQAQLVDANRTDQFLLGDDSNTAPPDSIPNSVVKRISGDGSVGFPHVRVAHRQAPIHTKGSP